MMDVRALCWCCLAIAACSEPVSEASNVTYARVAGVRVEVDGDPERATPRLDETARATVLVIGPDGPAAVSYAMSLCPASPETGARPTCAGPVIAGTQVDTPDVAPVLEWTGLANDPHASAQELLLLGTVCEVGVPDAQATQPGVCVDPSFVGVSFAARVTLLRDDASVRNHHPILDAAEIHIDGAPWSADTCVPAARDGREHAISIALNDPRREQVNDEPEELLLSWFTTAGDLDRHFSVLERDQPTATPLDATWTAPTIDTAHTTRARAHFTFVLRDQRGGITWVTRTLCLQPPAP